MEKILKEQINRSVKEFNPEEVHVIIKDSKGEEVVNAKGGAVLFALQTSDGGNVTEYNAGIAGTLSVNGTIGLLDTAITGVAKALARQKVSPDELLNAVGQITSKAIEDNWSEEEQMMAMMKASLKMLEMGRKSPLEDIFKR